MDYNNYFSTQKNKEVEVIPNISDVDIKIPSKIKSVIDYNNLAEGDNYINFEKQVVLPEDKKLNISKSASYGWNMGKSSLADFISAVPGGIDRFRDWVFRKHGDAAVDDDWLEHMQEYFQEKSIQYYKEAEAIGEPTGYKNRLIAEIAQVPGAVVQYIPSMIATRGMGDRFLRLPLSFAATDAIRVADEAPIWGTDSIAMEGLKGFGMGTYLYGASKVKNLPVKSMLLFGLGFVTAGDGFIPKTRADSEKRVAAGLTWAALGALDRVIQKKEPRQKIISKLEKGKKVSELTKEEIQSIPEDIKTA